jgi:alkylated DNA repair dioxygenase AlkB
VPSTSRGGSTPRLNPARAGLSRLGRAAGGPSPAARAEREPDDRAVRVPRAHWRPYAYSRTADDTDGAPVKSLPDDPADLGRAAVAAAYGSDGGFAPDAAIANLYDPVARLGLHCDAEEPADTPAVTLSIGDACLFRFADVGRRTAPLVDYGGAAATCSSSGDRRVASTTAYRRWRRPAHRRSCVCRRAD